MPVSTQLGHYMLNSWSIPAFIVLIIVFSLLRRLLSTEVNAREPPVIPQKLPYVGHVIGLLQYGLRYFDITSARHPYPIFTLPLLNKKIYVVTSPDLVREIQRNTKTLSFSPSVLPAIRRMLAFDDEGMKLISKNAESEDSFFGEMHRIQKSVLGPETASLEQLNSENRRLLMGYLNELRGQETVDLYAWLRHLFTKTNTTACFGHLNPFEKYPDLEQVFWDWEGNVKILLLGLPKFLAPGQYSVAVKSRQTLVDAFLEYADKGGPDSPSTSAFVRELYNLGIKRGLSHENSGRAMIGSVLAILANTIPTSFWLLVYIFSEPTLLAAVRSEIEPIMCSSKSGKEGRRKLLGFDLAQARDRCPLFVSCYEEVLRLSAGIAQMRHTVQETPLDNGRYLLTKECSIHMPTPFIHNDPASWGADAADFKADRFLKSKVTREQSGAFRPFGGGNALCPGRFFAFNEIVTFVGTMVLGFDVVPMGGTWKLPEMDRSKMPLSSLKPVVDIEVAVSRRVGYEDIDFQ